MMSTQTNRRDFLKTTTVTTSGLVLGVVLPGTVAETMAAGTLHTPNAWVHIADDNTITLISASLHFARNGEESPGSFGHGAR